MTFYFDDPQITFSFFNIENALEKTHENYRFFSDEIPPFDISSLDGVAKRTFESYAKEYEKLKTNFKQRESEKVIPDRTSKRKKRTVDNREFTYWHKKCSKLLSSEKTWDALFNLTKDNFQLKFLKKDFFKSVSSGSFKTEVLCRQYKILRKLSTFHENCTSDLRKARFRSHSYSPVAGVNVRIPFFHFFCGNFAKNLEVYLNDLDKKINAEKQNLALAMQARLQVANLSHNLNNGDVVFYLGKEIDRLTGRDFFFNKELSQVRERIIAIKMGSKELAQQFEEKKFDHIMVPERPVCDLDSNSFQIFCKHILTLSEKENKNEKIIKKFIQLSWFTVNNGINVRPLRSKKHVFLVPHGEVGVLRNNLSYLQIPLKMNINSIVEFNDGFNRLVKEFELHLFLNIKEMNDKNIDFLAKKSTDQFNNVSFNFELASGIARLIESAGTGIIYLCETLKDYDVFLKKNTHFTAERVLYQSWNRELISSLTIFNKYCDVLIYLFRNWSVKNPDLKCCISQVIVSLKKFSLKLDELQFVTENNIPILSSFKSIHDEGIDQIFFEIFVNELKTPKQFLVELDSGLVSYNTESSRTLVDIMVAVSTEGSSQVQLVGDAWLGKQYPHSLYNLRSAFSLKYFKKSSPEQILKLLLSCISRTLDVGSPGVHLLSQYHLEQKENNISETLLEEWKAFQSERVQEDIERIDSIITSDKINYDLLNRLFLRIPVKLLTRNLQIFLRKSLENHVECFDGSHWNFLPILKKFEDESLAAIYIEKKIDKNLEDTFLIQLGSSNELSCFNEIFIQFPKLRLKLQGKFVSCLERSFKFFKEATVEEIYKNLPYFQKSKFHFDSLLQIIQICITENQRSELEDQLNEAIFSYLKKCLVHEDLYECLKDQYLVFHWRADFKSKRFLLLNNSILLYGRQDTLFF